MRTIILFTTVLILLPFCFTTPWIGILTFSWLGYMNPHKYAWGAAPEFQFALIVALATLAGFLFTNDKDKFHMERESVIVVLLWLYFTFTTFFTSF